MVLPPARRHLRAPLLVENLEELLLVLAEQPDRRPAGALREQSKLLARRDAESPEPVGE